MPLCAHLVRQRGECLQDHLFEERRLKAVPALGSACLFCLGAAPAVAGSLDIEAAVGRERLTSPVVRVTPAGALVRLEGLHRLAGNHLRVAAGGMTEFGPADATHLAIGGRGDWKRSADAPDLDFGLVSTDAMLRTRALGGIVGIGPAWRRLWVAGDRFRDARSLQADWFVLQDDGGHWATMLELGTTRHPGDNADLDATLAGLTVQRHLDEPLPGLDALDLDLGVGRELNRHGYADLSNRYLFGRLSVDRTWGGIDWSAGAMLQLAAFDAPLLDTLPARRDRFTAFDFSAVHALTADTRLRLDLNLGRNQANQPLYDNRYRQFALSISRNW